MRVCCSDVCQLAVREDSQGGAAVSIPSKMSMGLILKNFPLQTTSSHLNSTPSLPSPKNETEEETPSLQLYAFSN